MSEEWSFEKDDFLTTTPYEALYAYHKEPFTHAAKRGTGGIFRFQGI